MNPPRTLLVQHGTTSETVVPLGSEAITIGRDPSATIQIDSPYVSRLHGRIELGPDAPVFVDLGSHNGSLLNGKPVQGPTRLRIGDVIVIADAKITCLGPKPVAAATQTYPRPQIGRTSATPTVTLVSATTPAAASGELYVDTVTHEVRVAGQPLKRPLSAHEFRLVQYLFEQQPRACTHRELGDAIWGPHAWDVHMLHHLVHRVKEKLEPDPATPRFLVTVPQIGYRLRP
jgi:hypothetical protein